MIITTATLYDNYSHANTWWIKEVLIKIKTEKVFSKPLIFTNLTGPKTKKDTETNIFLLLRPKRTRMDKLKTLTVFIPTSLLLCGKSARDIPQLVPSDKFYLTLLIMGVFKYKW